MRRATGYRLGGLFAASLWLQLAAPAALARPSGMRCASGLSIDDAISQGATRFALPEALLRTVIAIESNGSPTAVSPKGAMGLMQIMPGTWAGLRLRYALGADPFDPCDNILAGAAYLREMRDRYGDPGFLAAYNAGPGRYEAYLRGERSLPSETIAYVARVTARMGGGASLAPAPAPDPDAWRRANLFVRGADRDDGNAPVSADKLQPGAPAEPAGRSAEPVPETLFVVRSGTPK